MTATITRAAVTAAELDLELERARALARRRIAWLRARWPASPGFAGLAIGHEEADRLTFDDRAEHADAFFEHDPAAASATADLQTLDAALNQIRLEGRAPLGALSATLELDAVEHAVLALAVCAELDPAFARLCAYLADDATRAQLTPRLVCDLLAPGAGLLPAPAAALGPHGRLRHWNLVRIEGGGPWAGRALCVDERVLAIAAGDNCIDRRLRSAIEPLPATELPARLDEAAARAADLI
ncbi:MAG: hypothetical protein ACRDNS_26700, partial [Trebonia sp.]